MKSGAGGRSASGGGSARADVVDGDEAGGAVVAVVDVLPASEVEDALGACVVDVAAVDEGATDEEEEDTDDELDDGAGVAASSPQAAASRAMTAMSRTARRMVRGP